MTKIHINDKPSLTFLNTNMILITPYEDTAPCIDYSVTCVCTCSVQTGDVLVTLYMYFLKLLLITVNTTIAYELRWLVYVLVSTSFRWKQALLSGDRAFLGPAQEACSRLRRTNALEGRATRL